MFSIGQRLREERERLALSQDKLGEELGVDRKVIRGYEGNKTSPRADQLVKMMELGADVIYIISGRKAPLGVAQPESLAAYNPAERAAQVIRDLMLSEEDAEMLRALAVRLARE
jgi:transcriptional regulator with XRE-family HTH domain